MNYLGNKDILKLETTAFLCSQKCPAEVVLKSYDWAKEQREAGHCIVCSNHSQIEKDVFEILLKGKQPLILILPRSLKKNWGPKIVEAITQNRLLVISPFSSDLNKRITRENAIIKNKTIISLANKIVVGYKTKNGQLDKLLEEKEFDEL
jgi:predicted Rossmann fold nucleotide-binding protein DprA/Smf involved in DNA uptake